MQTGCKKAYTWEIENFSESNDQMISDPFSSGGCEWLIVTDDCKGSDYLSVHLSVCNPYSFRRGWRIRADFYFHVSNQSSKHLGKYCSTSHDFCRESSFAGFCELVPLNLFREDNKFTIEAHINVVEVVHQGNSTAHLIANNILEVHGSMVYGFQAKAAEDVFFEHPDIINEEDYKSKNLVVKTACMNLLLGLIETLNKPPESLLDIDLSNAHCKLSKLTEAGFKLDWLVTKLEDAKKAKSKAQNLLEDRIKYLELTLSDLKDEKMKSAADKKVYSFGFEFIDFYIKRFLFSCFSNAKH